jgi:Glycoside hydrolase 123 N-terminal domain
MRHSFVFLLLMFLVFRGPAKPSFVWWTTNALVKVRPSDVPPSIQQDVMLHAARNEFEAFQIVLRNDSEAVPDVDVEMSDLTGPVGSLIPKSNMTIYFEQYMNLQRASNIEGGVGEWPDPLIPRVDRYDHERRNAFPFALPKGRNQPLWVEIYVPPKTRPGHYSAQVTVASGSAVQAVIPVSLDVWEFELPSTSSLKTAFGFNGVTALKQHAGRYTNDDDLRAISHVYTRAALLHRVSAFGGPMIPPPFTLKDDAMTVDWSLYDTDVGSFLDGRALSKGDPLQGARATSVELRTHGSLDTDKKKVLYWREWTRHFEKKGWLDRLFNYVSDEPTAAQMPEVYRSAVLAHEADSRLRNLVTTPLRAVLDGPIDIWTPLINCFETKPGAPEFCEPTVPRRAYDSEIRKHRSLWWYQSCASHGCDIVGGKYFTGWPSYVIDTGAVSNRIMPWMSWKYRIDGELYYNMVEAFSRDVDPLQDAFLHVAMVTAHCFIQVGPGPSAARRRFHWRAYV